MIRVAIIGAGIGREHLHAYASLPERFEVVALCDLDVDRARRVVERAEAVGPTPSTGTGRVHVTDSIGDAIADGVDLVDVCLPPHLHVDTSIAALEAGKHVICEKPLAASLAEVDRLAAAARDTGLVVSPIFQYRYGLGMAQFRALQAAGLVGRPYVASIETHWNRPAAYYAVDWRGTWATEGGGAILGHSIHLHDLATAVLGPARSVFATVDTRVNDIEVEDCAAVVIETGGGALVTSSVTLGAADDTSRLRFVFDGVTVESDRSPYSPAARGWTFTARAPVEQAVIDGVVEAVEPVGIGYVGQFEAVADAIEGRPRSPAQEPMVTLADGRASVELVTAVYASARTGAPVAVPLGADHPLHHGWLPSG